MAKAKFTPKKSKAASAGFKKAASAAAKKGPGSKIKGAGTI